MSFEVIKPGILSTLQDWGRYGYQHIGLTTGGPMDEHAFCWANWLLENEMNMAQIGGVKSIQLHELINLSNMID